MIIKQYMIIIDFMIINHYMIIKIYKIIKTQTPQIRSPISNMMYLLITVT